jgi:hypothetical protein
MCHRLSLRRNRGRDAAARVALVEPSILVLLIIGLLLGVLAIVKPFTTAILVGAALAVVPLAGPQKTRQPGARVLGS